MSFCAVRGLVSRSIRRESGNGVGTRLRGTDTQTGGEMYNGQLVINKKYILACSAELLRDWAACLRRMSSHILKMLMTSMMAK